MTRDKTMTAVVLVILAADALRALGRADADESVTFVGAGDIANCENLKPAQATARLLDRIDGTVFTLGDHAYKHGDAQDFRNCYAPTCGRYKDRTRPAIGNHDTLTNRGRPYFDFFGENAGPNRRGYYSYDLGAWHIISLNSEASLKTDAPELTWLRQDLVDHPNDCALAYWHIPRFASGPHADPSVGPIWHILYDAGVAVVLNGHEHAYERFAPQDADGRADPTRGIREFIVGTGGGELEAIKQPAANVETYDDHTFGVLKLTLNPHAYRWEFVPIAGQRFRDTGEGMCRARR